MQYNLCLDFGDWFYWLLSRLPFCIDCIGLYLHGLKTTFQWSCF